jgi:hypothetical protein
VFGDVAGAAVAERHGGVGGLSAGAVRPWACRQCHCDRSPQRVSRQSAHLQRGAAA